MDVNELIRKLSSLKRRIHLNKGLHRLLLCLCAGGFAAAALAFVSLWVPVPFIIRYILYTHLASAAVGVFILLLSSPGIPTVMETADSLGLKERLTTAWQFRNDGSSIAKLQRNDAIEAISSINFKKLYPIKLPAKLIFVLAVSILMTSLSFMLPANARDSAQKIEELQQTVEEQLEKLEKIEKDITENGKLNDAELEKIKQEAARLAEELKKAKTEEEALKALSRTENELEMLDLQKQLDKLGEVFKQDDITSELGEAIQNKDITDLKQAIEQMINKLEREEISAEELAEMLKEVAEKAGNSKVTETLQEAAESLSSVSTTTQESSLSNLGSALSDMIQSQMNMNMSEVLGQMAQALQQAKSSISLVDSALASSGNAPSGTGGSDEETTGWYMQGSAGKPGEDPNSGSVIIPGSGGSIQTPNGFISQGQGQSGGGAGKGSTNEDSGNTGSEQSGGGREEGIGYEEEYERLYAPDYLGGNSDPSYVSGQKLDGGESSYSQSNYIPAGKEAILPYNEVLAQYGSEAASYMEESEIPAAMKEIVREYFESLK